MGNVFSAVAVPSFHFTFEMRLDGSLVNDLPCPDCVNFRRLSTFKGGSLHL